MKCKGKGMIKVLKTWWINNKGGFYICYGKAYNDKFGWILIMLVFFMADSHFWGFDSGGYLWDLINEDKNTLK